MTTVALFSLFSFVTLHSLQLNFCLHPLIFSNRAFVTDVAVRALRRRLLLTSATEITLSGSERVSRRLSAGGLSEDQHPARLWGRHQDHVLQPEQDRRRHQAHLPSHWDLPSGRLG